jgi:hypothetical protein
MLHGMQHLESTSFGNLTRLAIAGSLLIACGDDGPSDVGNGGRAGSAGTAGASGASGSAGASGASGSAGASGASGASGSGGNGGSTGMPDGGAEPPCRDCVELRVPIDDSDQTALFTFEGGPFDMSAAEIHFRMRPLTRGDQLIASPFLRDQDLQGFANLDVALSDERFPEDTWVTVQLEVSSFAPPDLVPAADAGPSSGDAGFDAGVLVPDPTNFDRSRVRRFGLQIGTTPNYAGRAATLVVLVDTVSFQGVVGNPLAEKTFDENAEGLTIDLAASTPGAELIHHPAD